MFSGQLYENAMSEKGIQNCYLKLSYIAIAKGKSPAQLPIDTVMCIMLCRKYHLHNCNRDSHLHIITIQIATHIFAAETVTCICVVGTSNCITATETVTCIIVEKDLPTYQ